MAKRTEILQTTVKCEGDKVTLRLTATGGRRDGWFADATFSPDEARNVADALRKYADEAESGEG